MVPGEARVKRKCIKQCMYRYLKKVFLHESSCSSICTYNDLKKLNSANYERYSKIKLQLHSTCFIKMLLKNNTILANCKTFENVI